MTKVIRGMLLVFLTSVHASGQSAVDSWDNLTQLQPGQHIEVVDMNLKSLKGTFVSFSDEGISFRTDGGETALERTNVFRVGSREKSHRGRNAAIGALVGGVAGLLTMRSALCDRPDPECEAIAGGMGLVVGLGAGVGVGAAMPTGRRYEVYRAPRRQNSGKTQ